MKCLACGNKIYCYLSFNFCHVERYRDHLDFYCNSKDIQFDIPYAYMLHVILDDVRKLMREGVKLS